MNKVYVATEDVRLFMCFNPAPGEYYIEEFDKKPIIFGHSNRFNIVDQTEHSYVLQLDKAHYGPTTMARHGAELYLCPKEDFDKACITEREYNKRWLTSLLNP